MCPRCRENKAKLDRDPPPEREPPGRAEGRGFQAGSRAGGGLAAETGPGRAVSERLPGPRRQWGQLWSRGTAEAGRPLSRPMRV